MTLDEVKAITEIVFYIAAILGGVLAFLTYCQNQSLERSRWAHSLYKNFFVKMDRTGIRRELDCAPDSDQVVKLVKDESEDFTNYLNFFEHVAYLVKCKQIKRADADAYFAYYFGCLKRHPAVVSYVRDSSNGYEMLAEYLGK